jgi:hypothetical protein
MKLWLLSNKLLIVFIVIAAVAVTSATYNWYHPKVKTITQTEYRTVTEQKEVVKIKRVEIPGPVRIITIDKQTIADKLDIHPLADNEHIISNADIPPSESGTSAVTVLNMDTGESKIIAKEKPFSLFGFPSNIEAGLRYGLASQSGQEGELFTRWQFLRIGKIYLGAYGEMTTKPEAKAMLEVSFRF